jgi:hypothetical protein
MGGGGGGAGWTGGGGGGPNYTVSTTSQFSAGGGGGGSSWASATASPTFSPITNGLATSCGPADNAYSTGLSLGYGGYGDGEPTGGAAGTGDAGCPGNIVLTFHGPPATPTLTSGSLTVTAGSAISAAITSSGATSYTESGTLPSGANLSSGTGAITGTPTTAGSYPFTVAATDQYGTSSAGNFTLTVNTAGASTLAFVQQPSDTFTGTAISPAVTVQVEDAYENPVSDNGLSVTLTPSANTIASGATASTNSSGLATFSTITINTAAINLTLTASAAGLSTSSPSSSFNVTVLVNNGDTFTDTASDGSGSGVKSVTYYYCAGLSGSCTSTSGTQIGSPATSSPYTVAWSSQPADGDYQVVAVGTDNVTNVSGPSTPIPVTVDNTAPTVSITYPTNGAIYTSSSWTGTITGTASDASSGISNTAVAVENTTTGEWWGGSSFNQSGADYLAAAGSTSWSYALAASKLTAGDHYSVVAQATDGAGNIGTSSVTFSIAAFGAKELTNGSCTSLSSDVCSISDSNATTSGDTELILVNVVTSGETSAAATVSSLSGPFTSASQVTAEQYPATSRSSSSDENYLFAWEATGNGSSGTTSTTLANVGSSSSFGTAYIEVIQLGAGDSVVNSNVGQGTNNGSSSTVAVAITPSSSSDSEIAFLGEDDGYSFSTPSGWTLLPSSTQDYWDSFSDPTIVSSQNFTVSHTGAHWGYIALEVDP